LPKSATRKTNKRAAKKVVLASEPAPVARHYWVIPTWWLNTVFGLFLLIPAGLLTQTFFNSFQKVMERHFWATEEFWFFSLGSMLWLLWFAASMWMFAEPRPVRVYVFGHELTHAVWVWIFGGSVHEFVAGPDGGYIRTNRDNFWISLSPYFYPIYSLFYNLAGAPWTFLWMTPLQIFFLLLGFTWMFHLSFSFWMIPKGQTDLTRHGTFFSLVVIYAMNIALLAVFLMIAAPEVSWFAFGRELVANTQNFFQLLGRALLHLFLPAESF
jgi:hypothetical protein